MTRALTVLAIAWLMSGCQRTEQRDQPEPEPRPAPIGEHGKRLDDPGTAAYHAAFCNKILPRATVERLIDVDSLVERRITKPFQAGVGECQLYTNIGGTQVEIAFAADCRRIHPRLESHKKALAGSPGYRELADLGIGGIHTSDGTVHRIVFNTDDPACTVYVSAVGTPSDPTEKLARHLAAALNARTAPR